MGTHKGEDDVTISADGVGRLFKGFARQHLAAASQEFQGATKWVANAGWEAHSASGLHKHLSAGLDHLSGAATMMRGTGDRLVAGLAQALDGHVLSLARSTAALNDVVAGAQGVRAEFTAALRSARGQERASLVGHLGTDELGKLGEAAISARDDLLSVQRTLTSKGDLLARALAGP